MSRALQPSLLLLAEQLLCSVAIGVQVLWFCTVLQQGFLLSLSVSLVLCRSLTKIQSRIGKEDVVTDEASGCDSGIDGDCLGCLKEETLRD